MKHLWIGLMVGVCSSTLGVAQHISAPQRYDPSNEVTVQGTIAEVSNQASPRTPRGTFLTLDTSTTTLKVHLGPPTGRAVREARFSAGQQVEVVGWIVNRHGTSVLLAREVRVGSAVHTFRTARGFPISGRAPRR